MRNLSILLLVVACSSPEKSRMVEEVRLDVQFSDEYPELLSDWNLFGDHWLEPGDSTFSYEINSPLFSDYAHKQRFIKLPSGEKIGYHSSETLDFPKGSILVKQFYYPKDFRKPGQDTRILETRLLINDSSEWTALVYRWNESQTDAKRLILGEEVPVEWYDESGKLQRSNYTIPSQPQCKGCHEFNGKLKPIGPTARQLNNGQLEKWEEKELIDLPDDKMPRLVKYEDEDEDLALRARAWLEVNCGHCHRKEGPAKNTGMYLLSSEADSYKLGVGKPPVAAGRGSGGLKYGIEPGRPENSILVHRIESLEPGEMMPELGRKLKHEEGIALIKEWILEMESDQP